MMARGHRRAGWARMMVAVVLGLSAAGAASPVAASEQMEFADGLFARGLYDMALEEYLKAGQSGDPSVPLDALLLRIGECHRHLGDKSAASAAYLRLVETYPESEHRFRAEFRRAELFVAAVRYAEAEQLLDALVARDPPEDILASASYFMAYCRDKQGNTEGALRGYRELVADHPDSPYVGYACLAAAELLGNEGSAGEEAMQLLQRAASDPPSERVAAEALFLLGSAAYARDDHERSAASFNELLTSYPGDRRVPEARLKAGWAFERSGRHAEALELAQAALADGGGDHEEEWLYLKANCERHLGQLEAASSTYDDLLSRFPAGSVHAAAGYERVLVAFNRGRHADVLALGKEPASLPGADEELLWILAESAEALDRADEAVGYYARIADDFPERPRAPVALFRRARLAEAEGDGSQASTLYRSLADRYPEHALAPEALYASGTVRASADQLDEALADWRGLTKRYPDFARGEDILFQQALVEIRTGQPAESMATLRALLERWPEGPHRAEAHYWLGVLLSDAGKLDEAEAELRKAREELPDERLALRARYRLAGILQQRGEAAEAAEELQALIETPVLEEMPPALLEWLARFRAEEQPIEPRKALLAARALLRAADEPVWRQLGWYYAGEANLAGGQRSAAIEAFGMAFDESAQTREQVMSALRLGRLALEDERYDDADRRFRAAGERASDPELAEVRARSYLGLAETARARGQLDEAVRRYLSVGILFEDEELTPHALYEAVQLLETLGRRGDRDRTAGELRARFPDSPWTEKLESRP